MFFIAVPSMYVFVLHLCVINNDDDGDNRTAGLFLIIGKICMSKVEGLSLKVR